MWQSAESRRVTGREKSQSVSFYLPPEENRMLDHLAREMAKKRERPERLSRSDVVREAIAGLFEREFPEFHQIKANLIAANAPTILESQADPRAFEAAVSRHFQVLLTETVTFLDKLDADEGSE